MTEQTATKGASSAITLDDETLARRVGRALTGIKPLCALGSPLHVQVKDGVVTLRGVVASYVRKSQVIDVVRSVPGVHQVCEELWV